MSEDKRAHGNLRLRVSALVDGKPGGKIFLVFIFYININYLFYLKKSKYNII
jgi:hypothetical protein